MASVTTTTTYPGNTLGFKTAIVRPGETFVLPPGAVIDSIITEGSITVTSNCDLPTPSAYKCGYFYMILDNDDNDLHSMDETSTYYGDLKIAGNTYNINRRVIEAGTDNPGTAQHPDVLNAYVPDQVIFSFLLVEQSTLSKRQGIKVYFRSPETVFDTLELSVYNHGAVHFYRPFETDQDCSSLEALSPIERSKTIILGT